MEQTIPIEIYVMKLIERSFGYFKDSPVMIVRPVEQYDRWYYDDATGRKYRRRFNIKLNDLWKYSDTHNELFESFIANKVIQICGLFDITVPKGERAFAQMMASIATTIMDGIDDLVKMPPYLEGHDDPDTVIDPVRASDMPDISVGMHP
jgi:hypothetical protein